MSNYSNYLDDFPRRCRDLLHLTEGAARLRGREVTLMLMVATSGMVVPYERLRRSSLFPHPADDRSSYPEAAMQFDDLMKQPFLTSALWGQPVGSWSMGDISSVSCDPDGWSELRRLRPLPPGFRVSSLIYTMRNGLVHGNTYTRRDAGGQIAALVFVRDATDRDPDGSGPYRFLHASPGDFRTFLHNWFAFIDGLHLPQTVALQPLEDAA